MATKRTLSRAAIVSAGREVAEQGGVEAVTMRRVAGLRGCSPMALYRHVDDWDELPRLRREQPAAGSGRGRPRQCGPRPGRGVRHAGADRCPNPIRSPSTGRTGL
ncbi:TetR/AcrR family transcriptional regulator [Actinoplanes sp. NBRC 101535]|uniref:TetR/AcrR family transcriptional regulator n=1 Tax=Actinoplanes sp. NBRC 101535 TaxID=3032196 RepID=UPI00255343EF|nr:TetR/AcrR family transcriptional regulator [Actinoplanes sp. NBRC 101535]